MKARRCLLADDHPVLLSAVSDFLAANGFEVVGPAGDGEQALSLATAERPELAVVDLRMPRLSGPELVARLLEAVPEIRVIVYTADASDDEVRRALDAGAAGVVLKEAPLEDLARAIVAVESGATYLDPVLAARTLGHGGRRGPALTPRELDVLRLLSAGHSHEEIGAQLAIGIETVRTHLRKASVKLDAATRTQAVATALRLGLID
jgi:DNA-binding NarL/FixJ family response regulator